MAVAFTTTILPNGNTQARFTLSQTDSSGHAWVFTDAIVMPEDQWNALTADQQSGLAQARFDNWYALANPSPLVITLNGIEGNFQNGESLESSDESIATLQSQVSDDAGLHLTMTNVQGAFAVDSVVAGMQSTASGTIAVNGS